MKKQLNFIDIICLPFQVLKPVMLLYSKPKRHWAVVLHATIVVMSLLWFLGPSHTYAEEPLQEIVITPGETLWSIANKYLKDPKRWVDIVKHNPNANSDPTLPVAGSKLKIPVTLIKEEFQNAQLIKAISNVQYRRKATQDWKPAQLNMLLFYDDGLRTLEGSQAQVRFPTKEVIQINENSYIVLRPEKIRQEISLLQGDIRASRAKVITPRGTVVKPQGNNSDFQAKVRDDESEVIFVYKGKVDVTAKGKTITVREGFGTHVPKASVPSEPLPLPQFNDFNPADMTVDAPETAYIHSPKPTTSLKPPTSEPARSTNKSKSMVSNNILVDYRLQLAQDKDFKSIVLDKNAPIGTAFNIKKQSIPDGVYHMRVAFLDALGGQGEFSQTSIVIKDSVAPEIKNILPSDGMKFKEDAFCDVSGDVSGASLITVNGEVVFISPTGRFSKFLPLREGENPIRIMAEDSQGNQTIIERKVFYNP